MLIKNSVILMLLVTLVRSQSGEYSEEDEEFQRKVQRVQSHFRDPFARAYVRYFIKNRHQTREREKREVKDYNYYRNYPQLQRASNTYSTIPVNSYNTQSASNYYNPSPISRASYRPGNNYYGTNSAYYTRSRRPVVARPVQADLQKAASSRVKTKFRPTPMFF